MQLQMCVQGVLEKFSQIQPSLLFSVTAVIYNGKLHSQLDKLKQVAEGELMSSSLAIICCFDVRVLTLHTHTHPFNGPFPGLPR